MAFEDVEPLTAELLMISYKLIREYLPAFLAIDFSIKYAAYEYHERY